MSITLGIGHSSCNQNCPCKNIKSNLSIWTCALEGNFHLIERRIREKPSLVNLADSYGYIALHYAAQRGHVDIVNFLIQWGSPVDGLDPPNGCGATPLHRCAYNGHLNVCELLIKAGADIDARDLSFQDMRTPLMKAASRGHRQLVDMLIHHGSNISLVDSQGLTYHQILEIHSEERNSHCGKIETSNELIRGANEVATTPTNSSQCGIACSLCGKETLAVMSIKGQIVCLQCGKMNSCTY